MLYVSWRPPGWRIEDAKYPPEPGFASAVIADGFHLELWFEVSQISQWSGFGIPLWMPFALSCFSAGVLWYRDRRHALYCCHRFKKWMAPKRRLRVTVGMSLGMIVLHFITVELVSTYFPSMYQYFFPIEAGYLHRRRVLEIGMLVLTSLGLASPVLGVFWTWLIVRTLNRWRREFDPMLCSDCGYDLTGNTSGICSECGSMITFETVPESSTQLG